MKAPRLAPGESGHEGRPLGPAAVYGAVYGVCAAAPLAAWMALSSVTDGASVLALGVSLDVGNALSVRLAGDRAKRAARFLGGFLAPFLAMAPLVTLDAAARMPSLLGGWLALAVLALGLALGVGQVTAGPVGPAEGALRRAGRIAAVIGSTTVTLAFLAGAITRRADPTFKILFGGLLLALLAPVPALGAVLSSAIVRRLERLLEPEWEARDPLRAMERHGAHVASARRAERNARDAFDPGAARRAREAALEHAWAALAEARGWDELEDARARALVRVADALVALGRNAELEPLLRDPCFPDEERGRFGAAP